MMSLLVPLGLLGLLGIVALIIIYIIRPNYQVQHVSTTYVWKLALKYRRKRIPTSRLRNILIFLCQVLALTAISLILAMPVIDYRDHSNANDVIYIIDSSASMYTVSDDSTRFQKAVESVMDECEREIVAGHNVSVIIADDDPEFIGRRVDTSGRYTLNDTLIEYLEDDACYYGTSDMAAALELSEDVILENPSARVVIYTDSEYEYIPNGVEVIPVAREDEWNASILNVTAELEENYYVITAQIACYGRDSELDLRIDVKNAITASSSIEAPETFALSMPLPIDCSNDQTYTVIFKKGGGQDTDTVKYVSIDDQMAFYSYENISATIQAEDNFAIDNQFYIYGGAKAPLRIQYRSSTKVGSDESGRPIPGPNIFVNGVLAAITERAFPERYDYQITEVKQGEQGATEGFDLYIFEHNMPERMPSDGVVFLFDPADIAPVGSRLTLRGTELTLPDEIALNAPDPTLPLLEDVVAQYITVSKYIHYAAQDVWTTLLTCRNEPVISIAKQDAFQAFLIAFSVHWSNIGATNEWAALMYNVFDYFFPALVSGHSFEVGQPIVVNGRGETVSFAGEEDPITQFPATVRKSIPGTYAVNQMTWFGKEETTDVYVHIPSYESNICRVETSLDNPFVREDDSHMFDDLLVYFAAALVGLLFVEWWLQSRENK